MTVIFHGKDAEEYRFISAPNGLTGWIRKDLPEEFFAEFVRDPGGFLDGPSAQVLKDDGKTKVVQIKFSGPSGAAPEVVVKRFRYSSPLRRLGFLFSASPGLRSLQGALLLKRKGFYTAAPLAAFEFRNWNDLGTSYYITEAIGDSCSLRSFWMEAAPALARGEKIRLGRSVVRQAAELFARLHAEGIYHGDLKGSNILMQDWKSGQRRFFLIDLDRVTERGPLSRAKRIKNLLQIKVSWGARERVYFYLRYAALYCSSKPEAKALVLRALAFHRQQSRAPRARPAAIIIT